MERLRQEIEMCVQCQFDGNWKESNVYNKPEKVGFETWKDFKCLMEEYVFYFRNNKKPVEHFLRGE